VSATRWGAPPVGPAWGPGGGPAWAGDAPRAVPGPVGGHDGVEDDRTAHERVQDSPEFRDLRRRLRVFVFPMTAAFLLWYLAFVLMASYARDLMAVEVVGSVNVGLVVGLGQFASTFAITALYVRYARRRLDPLAARLRTRIEEERP
jgi:uncharacterized membrane protein (DUF485 family)